MKDLIPVELAEKLQELRDVHWTGTITLHLGHGSIGAFDVSERFTVDKRRANVEDTYEKST